LEKDVEQTAKTELGERRRVALDSSIEDALERATADELHREVSAALRIDAHVVHGDDVRVLELRGDLRLFDEAREERGRHLVARLGRDLHGELAAELRVDGADDGRRGAAADLFARPQPSAPQLVFGR